MVTKKGSAELAQQAEGEHDNNVELPKENDDLIKYHDTSEQSLNKRPRKKRKIFSCDNCRKVKTRCDFEPVYGKCHRCNVLQLDCSLGREQPGEVTNIANERTVSFPESNIHESVAEVNNLRVNKMFQTTRPRISNLESSNNFKQMEGIDKRLNIVENSILTLNNKMDIIISLLKGEDNAETINSTEQRKYGKEGTSTNTLDDNGNHVLDADRNAIPVHTTPVAAIYPSSNTMEKIKLKEYPFKILNDIDERLFPLTATSKQEAIDREQRPSAVARVNFLKFYKEYQPLCHMLAKEFLVRSHFWIIPGGAKEIDESFAKDHLFFTSVCTIIAMSSANNTQYINEQRILYPLVERLLTNTLTMFEKLKPHDIEAILYCCMFHISRKSKRHRQLKFNALILSNFALFSLLNNIDFFKIKERVSNEEYNSKDLYHLRILNSLTACHLEYSILYGSIIPQDNTVREFNNLIAKYPQANFGDDIKISEINLADIVIDIFSNFRQYFFDILKKYIEKEEENSERKTSRLELLIFPELCYWLKNWKELLAKDGGGVLLFTYDFYHIMICRSFLNEFMDEIKPYPTLLNNVLLTTKEHSFSLLNEFLRLPPSLIRGAPILTTNQLVYACLTLCDFLHWYEKSERQKILNICTKVYWHLNTIGEKLNEVTENVGKIIKSIITISKTRVNELGTGSSSVSSSNLIVGENSTLSQPLRIRKPSTTNIEDNSLDSNRTRSPTPLRNFSPHSGMQHQDTSRNSIPSSTLPDVDRFNSFEDFFQDFFDHLKPNAKKMFSSSSSNK